MSYEIPGFKPGSHKSAADLSASQYCAVKLDSTAGQVALGSAAALCVGILQNKPIAGEAAEIELDGISKAKAGAAFALNAELMSDAAGKLITATGSGARVVAVALEAAGAANELVAVKVIGLAGRAL